MNFDNDPVGICREVLRVVKHWMSHGVRVFRVDNPHTKPVAFWEWLLKEIRRTDPDVIFLSEAFTRPRDDARPRRGRLPPELHLLHLAQRQVGARGVPPRGLARVRPHDAAELLRQHPRHPPRLPPVRRPGGVQDPRGDRGDGLAELGRLRRLRALRARRGAPGQRGVPRHEKYQIRIRDWDGAAAEGRTLAPYLTRLNEIRREHPALQLLRNTVVHSSDDENVLVFSKSPHGHGHRHRRWSTSTRTRPARPRSTSTCPPWACRGATRSPCTTRSPAQDWSWSQHNYVRLDPGHEPAHVLTVRSNG